MSSPTPLVRGLIGLVSAALGLAVLVFLTEYANAFSHPWPAESRRGQGFFGDTSARAAIALGLASVIVQVALVVGCLAPLAAR